MSDGTPFLRVAADRIGAPGSARIAGKNTIPGHQRRKLVLNHPDRREDGRHSRQRHELCVRERGVLTPCALFSWMKTAKRMRSIDVRSWNVPMGRVLRRTSRKRRSMALVVLTRLRSARVG